MVTDEIRLCRPDDLQSMDHIAFFLITSKGGYRDHIKELQSNRISKKSLLLLGSCFYLQKHLIMKLITASMAGIDVSNRNCKQLLSDRKWQAGSNSLLLIQRIIGNLL